MTEHDGCYGCLYDSFDTEEMPCAECKGTTLGTMKEYEKRPDNYTPVKEFIDRVTAKPCDGNCVTERKPETPEETIRRLEFMLDKAEEDRNFYMKRANSNEYLLHNLLLLLSNPWLKIENMEGN